MGPVVLLERPKRTGHSGGLHSVTSESPSLVEQGNHAHVTVRPADWREQRLGPAASALEL